ncbi:MAG: hypothetical protein QM689_05675 [Oscillospiraceae bacterium]
MTGFEKLIAFLTFAAFVAGMIVLQVWLSKRSGRLPGLVLPAICFVMSLMMLLTVSVRKETTQTATTPEKSGASVPVQSQTTDASEVLPVVLPLLLTANIPTTVLLLIYGGIRGSMKKNAGIAKMNVQDLE